MHWPPSFLDSHAPFYVCCLWDSLNGLKQALRVCIKGLPSTSPNMVFSEPRVIILDFSISTLIRDSALLLFSGESYLDEIQNPI